MKVIVLNGAPMTGKDSIADKLPMQSFSFKMGIYDYIEDVFGEYFLEELLEDLADRDVKDKELIRYDNKSPRQFLQYISEDIVKPRHGQGYFGKVVADKIMRWKDSFPSDEWFVISDGGFGSEIESLNWNLPEGSQVFVANLHRKGCDFTGDTRGFVEFYDNDAKYGFHNEHFCVIENNVLATAMMILEAAVQTLSEGE